MRGRRTVRRASPRPARWPADVPTALAAPIDHVLVDARAWRVTGFEVLPRDGQQRPPADRRDARAPLTSLLGDEPRPDLAQALRWYSLAASSPTLAPPFDRLCFSHITSRFVMSLYQSLRSLGPVERPEEFQCADTLILWSFLMGS